MRLKPAGIFIIVAIIAVLAYFAIKSKNSDTKNSDYTADQTTNTSSGTTDANNNNTAPPATKPASGSEERQFNYTPEKPENGALRGVVEVGATGFNSFVINMDDKKRWEIVSKDFGESLAYEGMATTEDIRLGLKNTSLPCLIKEYPIKTCTL
ncbi:MAG: hypothetical protein WKF59_09795 [Chitinophagaceae bacterium]